MGEQHTADRNHVMTGAPVSYDVMPARSTSNACHKHGLHAVDSGVHMPAVSRADAKAIQLMLQQ